MALPASYFFGDEPFCRPDSPGCDRSKAILQHTKKLFFVNKLNHLNLGSIIRANVENLPANATASPVLGLRPMRGGR